jgi:hypothetical protein
MSVAGKQAAFVLVVLVTLATLSLGTASAQIGPYNPSGGSSLRPSTEEGTGPFTRAGFLSRNLSLGTGWQGWLASYAVSRPVIQTASWSSDGRSVLAVKRRPLASR